MRFLCSIAALLLATTASTLADDDHKGRINVRDFDAKCNGTHDDTLAFKKAIAAAPFGGVVFVPPGNCVVSDTLVISTKPVSIIGDGLGSQIFQRSDRTLLQLVNTTGVMIKDLFLGSAATSAGTALIELTYSHRNRIDNVSMLGSNYGLHLAGSLLNNVVDLRSAINFRNAFFAVSSVSTNQYWVYAEPNTSGPYPLTSVNANTFINPVLEGGTNEVFLSDVSPTYPKGSGQGSLHIVGGTMEGIPGTALTFYATSLNSSITGVHFEANGVDVLAQAAENIRISAIVSVTPGTIKLMGDTRNVAITDSVANNIYIDLGDGVYPAGALGPGTGTGAKRIILQNVTTCVSTPSVIYPAPTGDPYFGGVPNGPSSPVIANPAEGNAPRKDIVYTNIGQACGGG